MTQITLTLYWWLALIVLGVIPVITYLWQRKEERVGAYVVHLILTAFCVGCLLGILLTRMLTVGV